MLGKPVFPHWPLPLLAAASLLVAACSTVPSAPEPSGFLRDSDFRLSQLPPPTEILALSEDMQRYLKFDIATQLRREGNLRGLLAALEKQTQLKLEYDAARTRTAAEAFAARRGNCLSLTLMTAALARGLGLAVSYRKVLVDEPWDRQGGLLIRSGHVNIALETNPMTDGWSVQRSNGIIIDFLPHADIARQRAITIDEQTVLAMYMNNRAAESLVAGDIDMAYSWVREAITTAPRYVDAYNTLGVIYLRRRIMVGAELVFMGVLEQEPENVAAMANLIDVLDQRGNAALAGHWRLRLQAFEDRPPFYHFDLGVAALKEKDFRTARALFTKELARNAYCADALFGLAVANLGLRQPREAEHYLHLAIDASPQGRERQLYAAKLAWLKKAQEAN